MNQLADGYKTSWWATIPCIVCSSASTCTVDKSLPLLLRLVSKLWGVTVTVWMHVCPFLSCMVLTSSVLVCQHYLDHFMLLTMSGAVTTLIYWDIQALSLCQNVIPGSLYGYNLQNGCTLWNWWPWNTPWFFAFPLQNKLLFWLLCNYDSCILFGHIGSR